MKNLKDIIEDSENLQEYCSKVIYAKIGYAQILSRKSISNFEEVKASANLLDQLHHIRKIMVTDRRVTNIEDFHGDTHARDLSGMFTRIVPNSVFWGINDKSSEDVDRTAVALYEPVQVKLRLEPENEQRHTWENYFGWSADVLEECWAWWNGEVFLAYTTDPVEANKYLGQKTRDLLMSLFKDSEVFESVCIGPSPIHPDIIIPVFSKERLKQRLTEADTMRLTREEIKLGKDIVVPILVDSEDEVDIRINQATRLVYGRLLRSMRVFYQALENQSLIVGERVKFRGKFKQLINELLAIQEVPTYKFWNRKSLSKSLGKLDLQIHLALAEEYELRSLLTEARAGIISLAEQDKLCRLLRDYFIDTTTEHESIDRDCVSSALRHVDEELSRHSAFNIQLMSAVLGAIIAVALMYAGAYLHNLFGS